MTDAVYNSTETESRASTKYRALSIASKFIDFRPRNSCDLTRNVPTCQRSLTRFAHTSAG
jgi:hypothetical protein